MPAITYTADDLTQVRKALLSGTLEVRFQDRTVTYRKVEELLAIIGTVETQLAGQPMTRQIRMFTNKGL